MRLKRLLTGLEALARGAAEHAVELVVAHPSRRVEPVLDAAEQEGLEAESAPGERTAVEVALGARQAGGRAVAVVATLGPAVDVIRSAASAGGGAGLVVVVVDDPAPALGHLPSDARALLAALEVPCLEPADARDCKEYLAAALALSERWQLPVLVRLTPEVALGARPVELGAPAQRDAAGFSRERRRRVLSGADASDARLRARERLAQVAAYAVETPLNRIELRHRALGVVTGGAAYHQVREWLPDASVLRLGLPFPLPTALVREFAGAVERVVVVEESEPVLEDALRALGIACQGKDLVPRRSELAPEALGRLNGSGGAPSRPVAPARAPELCAACPQRPVLQALKRVHATVVGEPGCAADAGSAAPLDGLEVALAPGSAAAVALGAEAVLGERVRGRQVAVLGESAFLQGGLLALAHAAAASAGGTVVVTDDGTAGRLGEHVDVARLARALGAERIREVDAYDLPSLEEALRDELARPELSVVVARASCRCRTRERLGSSRIVAERCNRCGACLRLGCPALSEADQAMRIDAEVCVGCGVCRHACRAGAIVHVGEVGACLPA